MEKAVFTSSPAVVYQLLNTLTSLAARMLDEDVENALSWYKVALIGRQLLSVTLHSKEEVRA
jgi:hypothetical protein